MSGRVGREPTGVAVAEVGVALVAVVPAPEDRPATAAACGRSVGSDGHTPLPKRGPHLRKRPPPRTPAAGWPRRPGIGRAARAAGCQRGRGAPPRRRRRAAAHAPRARACTTSDSGGIADTAPQQQTAATATHPEPTPTEADRAPTDARPRPSATRPYSQLLPPRTPRLLRVASTVHPPAITTRTNPPHHTLPLPRCRRPAPGPPAPAWAGPPRFTWTVEEGRPAHSDGLPSSKAQAGSGKQAGGGAAARSRLRRTPRDEHQETNTKKRTPPERTSARAG